MASFQCSEQITKENIVLTKQKNNGNVDSIGEKQDGKRNERGLLYFVASAQDFEVEQLAFWVAEISINPIIYML